MAERYPVGAEARGFVDPADPSVAFLERRWSGLPHLAVLVGTLPMLFVLGLGVLLAGWRRPGVALGVALAVGVTAASIQSAMAVDYYRGVPGAEQTWWMHAAFAGALLLSLGPLLLSIKARRLHALYIWEPPEKG